MIFIIFMSFYEPIYSANFSGSSHREDCSNLNQYSEMIVSPFYEALASGDLPSVVSKQFVVNEQVVKSFFNSLLIFYEMTSKDYLSSLLESMSKILNKPMYEDVANGMHETFSTIRKEFLDFFQISDVAGVLRFINAARNMRDYSIVGFIWDYWFSGREFIHCYNENYLGIVESFKSANSFSEKYMSFDDELIHPKGFKIIESTLDLILIKYNEIIIYILKERKRQARNKSGYMCIL